MEPSSSKNAKKDDSVSGSEMPDDIYREKQERLQKYVPFLKRVIDTLTSKTKDSSKDLHLRKIKSLLELLTNKNKRVNLKFLVKSELALESLHKKYNVDLNRLMASKSINKIGISKGASVSPENETKVQPSSLKVNVKEENISIDKDCSKEDVLNKVVTESIVDKKSETTIITDKNKRLEDPPSASTSLTKNKCNNTDVKIDNPIQKDSTEKINQPKKFLSPPEANIDIMIVSSDDEDVIIVSPQKTTADREANPALEYSDISDNENKFFTEKTDTYKIEGLSDISDVESFEKDVECPRQRQDDGRHDHSRKKRKEDRKSRSRSKEKHSKHKDKSYKRDKSKERDSKSRKSEKNYAERSSRTKEKGRENSKESCKNLPLNVLSRKFSNINGNVNVYNNNNNHKDRATSRPEKSKPLLPGSSTNSSVHKKFTNLSLNINKTNKNLVNNIVMERETDTKSSSPNVDFYAGHKYLFTNEARKPKEPLNEVRSTKPLDAGKVDNREMTSKKIQNDGTNEQKSSDKDKSKNRDFNMNLLGETKAQVDSKNSTTLNQTQSEDEAMLRNCEDDIEIQLKQMLSDRVDSDESLPGLVSREGCPWATISELMNDEASFLCSTVNANIDLGNDIFENIECDPPYYMEEVCVETTENDGEIAACAPKKSSKDQNSKGNPSKAIKDLQQEQNTSQNRDEKGNPVRNKENETNKVILKTSDSTKKVLKESSSHKDKKRDETKKHASKDLKTDKSSKHKKDRHSSHSEKHTTEGHKIDKDRSIHSSKSSTSKHTSDTKSNTGSDKHKSHAKSDISSHKVQKVTKQEDPSSRHNPGRKSTERGNQEGKDTNIPKVSNSDHKTKSETSSKVKHSETNIKNQITNANNTNKQTKALEETKKQKTHLTLKTEESKLVTTKEDNLKAESLKQYPNSESKSQNMDGIEKLNDSGMSSKSTPKSDKNSHKKLEGVHSQKPVKADSNKLSNNQTLSETSSENSSLQVDKIKERRKSQKPTENLRHQQPEKKLESQNSKPKHIITRDLIADQLLKEIEKKEMWDFLLSSSQGIAQNIERMKQLFDISDEELSKDDILVINNMIKEKCLSIKARKETAPQTPKSTKKHSKPSKFSRELQNLHDDIKENMDDDVFKAIGRRISSINSEVKTRNQILHNDNESCSSRNSDESPQKLKVDKKLSMGLKRRKSMFCDDPIFHCYPVAEPKKPKEKQAVLGENIKKRRKSTISRTDVELQNFRNSCEQSIDKFNDWSDDHHVTIKTKASPKKRRKSIHQESFHWDRINFTDDEQRETLKFASKNTCTNDDKETKKDICVEKAESGSISTSANIMSNKEIRNSISRRRKSICGICGPPAAKQTKIQNRAVDDHMLSENWKDNAKLTYFNSLSLREIVPIQNPKTLSNDDRIDQAEAKVSDDPCPKVQTSTSDTETSEIDKRSTPKICLKRNTANPFTWTSSLSHDESDSPNSGQLEKLYLPECEVGLVRLEEEEIIKYTKGNVLFDNETESTNDAEDKEPELEEIVYQVTVSPSNGDTENAVVPESKDQHDDVVISSKTLEVEDIPTISLVPESKDTHDVVISSKTLEVEDIPTICLDSDDDSIGESIAKQDMIISLKNLKSDEQPKASPDSSIQRTNDLCSGLVPQPLTLTEDDTSLIEVFRILPQSPAIDPQADSNSPADTSNVVTDSVQNPSNDRKTPLCVPVEVIVSPRSKNLGSSHIYISRTNSEIAITSTVLSGIEPKADPVVERTICSDKSTIIASEEIVSIESEPNIIVQESPVEATSTVVACVDESVGHAESHTTILEDMPPSHLVETSEVSIFDNSTKEYSTVTPVTQTENDVFDTGTRQSASEENWVVSETADTTQTSTAETTTTCLAAVGDIVASPKHAEVANSVIPENDNVCKPFEPMQDLKSNPTLHSMFEQITQISTSGGKENDTVSREENISSHDHSEVISSTTNTETSCIDLSSTPQKTGSVIVKGHGIRRKISMYRRNSVYINNNSAPDTPTANKTIIPSPPISSPGPTVYQVISTGYSFVSPSEQSFHCLVQNCQFIKTRVINELYEHFIMQHGDVRSTSPCKTCGRLLSTESNMIIGIADEIKHIKMYHNSCIFIRKDLNSTATETTRTQLQSEETSGNRPKETCFINSPEVAAINANNGNNEKVSTTVNLLTKPPVLAILKPWTNKSKSIKTVDQCMEMLRKYDMINTFKCMGDNCVFSTSSINTMYQHFEWHQGETRNAHSNSGLSWLECAYCDGVSLDFKDLLQHVVVTHPRCDYQCMKCFYRGSSAEDLCNHAAAYHSPPPYCDTNRGRQTSEAIRPAPIRSRRATVCAPLAPFEENGIQTENQNLRSPLICPECSYQSQSVQELTYHKAVVHRPQIWDSQPSAIRKEPCVMSHAGVPREPPPAVPHRESQRPIDHLEQQPTHQRGNVYNTVHAGQQNIAEDHYTLHHRPNASWNTSNLQVAYNSTALGPSLHAPSSVISNTNCNVNTQQTNELYRNPVSTSMQLPQTAMSSTHNANQMLYNSLVNSTGNAWGRETQTNTRTVNPPPYPTKTFGASQVVHSVKPTKTSPSAIASALRSHLISRTTAPDTLSHGNQTQLPTNMLMSDTSHRLSHMHANAKVSPPGLSNQGGSSHFPSTIPTTSARAISQERPPPSNHQYSWHRPLPQIPALYKSNPRNDSQPNLPNQWQNNNSRITSQATHVAHRSYTIDSSMPNQSAVHAPIEKQHMHTSNERPTRADLYSSNWSTGPSGLPANSTHLPPNVSSFNSNPNSAYERPVHPGVNQLTTNQRLNEPALHSNDRRDSNNRNPPDSRSVQWAAQSSVTEYSAANSIENINKNIPLSTSPTSPTNRDPTPPVNISVFFKNPSATTQNESELIYVVENCGNQQSTVNPQPVNVAPAVNTATENVQTNQPAQDAATIGRKNPNSAVNLPILNSSGNSTENIGERQPDNHGLSTVKQNDMLYHKTVRFVPEGLLSCPRKECQDMKFKDTESLEIHLSVQHLKQKSHACKFCNTRSSNFIEHLLFHSKVLYSCCESDFLHHSYKHVSYHTYTVHGDREQRMLIHLRGNGPTKSELFNFLTFKDEQFWKCYICDRVTDSSYAYVANHIEVSHPKTVYDCRRCYFSATHKNVLELHHASAHHQEALDFNLANPRPIVNFKNTVFSKVLENCIAKMSSVPRPQADICGRPTSNSDSFVLTCRHCLAYFPKLEFMMRHWRDEHGPPSPFLFSISKKFACNYCTLNASFDYLKDHHFKTHSTVPLKIGDNTYKEDTNLLLSSVDVVTQSLLDQLREGISSVSRKCVTCNIIFKEEESIHRHIEQAHNNEEVPFEKYSETCMLFGCNFCQIFYNDEINIIKHIIEHIRANQLELNFEPIDFYKINCIVLFPNGLILRKDELTNTKYGSIKNFCNLMNLPYETNEN